MTRDLADTAASTPLERGPWASLLPVVIGAGDSDTLQVGVLQVKQRLMRPSRLVTIRRRRPDDRS